MCRVLQPRDILVVGAGEGCMVVGNYWGITLRGSTGCRPRNLLRVWRAAFGRDLCTILGNGLEAAASGEVDQDLTRS